MRRFAPRAAALVNALAHLAPEEMERVIREARSRAGRRTPGSRIRSPAARRPRTPAQRRVAVPADISLEELLAAVVHLRELRELETAVMPIEVLLESIGIMHGAPCDAVEDCDRLYDGDA